MVMHLWKLNNLFALRLNDITQFYTVFQKSTPLSTSLVSCTYLTLRNFKTLKITVSGKGTSI